MSWLEDQERVRNLEDYQAYRITMELEGRMAPDLESVIRLINQRRKNNEKIQSEKGKSA